MPVGKHYEVHICVFEMTNDTRKICGDPIDSIGAWPLDARPKRYSTVESAERDMIDFHRAAFSPNLTVMRNLPWTCGDCAKQTVDSVKNYDGPGGGLVGTCSSCGAEWVTGNGS